MKAIPVAASLFLSVLAPVFATPSTRRPSQTTLKATFKLPVMIEGKQSGWVMAKQGTLVNVDHMRRNVIMVSLGSASAWVKRSDTDFDQRFAAFKAGKQKLMAANAAQDAAFKKQEAAAAVDFQRQHAAFDNPLNKGPYDQQRAVPELYDGLGRRYHIGVFGQRVYD